MKLVLLHLSDIHIKLSADNPVLSRAGLIAAATASVASGVECCFIVVTGDIAFSGAEGEYELAKQFFMALQTDLSARLPGCESHFVFVPGNHDCDFSEACSLREVLLNKGLNSEDFREEVFSEFVKVQRNYECFASSWPHATLQEGVSSRLYGERVYTLSQGTVRFRLINSAWMSAKEESQGKIIFPVNLLQSGKYSPAGIVATLLHHPYNWFESANGRELRKQLESSSDLILTGHEHEGDYYRKEKPDQSSDYFEGGILQDPSDLYHSSYNVLLLNFDESKTELYEFAWSEQGRYERTDVSVCTDLRRNLNRLQNEYVLRDSFQLDFIHLRIIEEPERQR